METNSDIVHDSILSFDRESIDLPPTRRIDFTRSAARISLDETQGSNETAPED